MKVVVRLLTVFALAGMMSSLDADDLSSPVGYWRTIDDSTGKPRGIVKIEEVNGELVGHVVKVFPRPGEEENPVCVKCKGELKGKRAIGMRVLWGMRKDGDEWSGGYVMDPDNGETYKGYVKLISSGRKLKLRGYIGISLFGRSQEWVRLENYRETTTPSGGGSATQPQSTQGGVTTTQEGK